MNSGGFCDICKKVRFEIPVIHRAGIKGLDRWDNRLGKGANLFPVRVDPMLRQKNAVVKMSPFSTVISKIGCEIPGFHSVKPNLLQCFLFCQELEGLHLLLTTTLLYPIALRKPHYAKE